jgi:Holliday junction resolvasome RuvABC endonuclease subunit
MLGHILKRPIESSYFDASDALAVAVCHLINQTVPWAVVEKTILGRVL